MSRTHVRRRRSASVATLLLALHLGLPAAARAVLGTEPSVSRPGARTYVVRHGDTLWGIATRLDPARDPRTVVEALAAANGVRDAAIVPGQALQLPAAG
jgi:nucleoid-associated protein YgaU